MGSEDFWELGPIWTPDCLWVQVGINSQYWDGVEMKGKLADITGIMMTS
jgi:hypothetical protein